MATSYLDHDEAARRYPRLIRAMRWVACLNSTEAQSAIIMHRAGHEFAGEAVNHFGGCRAVIRRAFRCRHASRRAYA